MPAILRWPRFSHMLFAKYVSGDSVAGCRYPEMLWNVCQYAIGARMPTVKSRAAQKAGKIRRTRRHM